MIFTRSDKYNIVLKSLKSFKGYTELKSEVEEEEVRDYVFCFL